MDHLWAPWRMAYIGPGNKHDEGCIFCTKPSEQRDEENLLLYRSEYCFVLMNLYPYNNGHLMIAPYVHVPSIEELNPTILTDIMLTTKRCLMALGKALHPDGYNMGINQGTIAGAGITDHMHFHIVPRWNGDTNFMPILANTKVMPDYLKNTYRQIRPYLDELQAATPGEEDLE